MLAEDHTLVRDMLHDLLEVEPDLNVVGAAADGDEAVRLAEDLRPDVLVLDVNLPGRSGIAVAHELRAALPELRIVVVTGYDKPELARAMVRLGVSGYLQKTAPLKELIAAVRAAFAGAVTYEPAVARMIAGLAGLVPEPEPTPRELDVLRLVAEGHTNRTIAACLGIGEATIETHLHLLFRKFGVGSRTQLVDQARRRGWLG